MERIYRIYNQIKNMDQNGSFFDAFSTTSQKGMTSVNHRRQLAMCDNRYELKKSRRLGRALIRSEGLQIAELKAKCVESTGLGGNGVASVWTLAVGVRDGAGFSS